MEQRQVKAHPVAGGLRPLSLPAFLARFGLLMLASGLMPFLSSPAQQQAPSEYEVKAAYLYYFGKFVTWPPEAEASGNSFVICVLGEDPFGPALDRTIVGESIRGTNVVVRRVGKAQEALGCRVLFISASEEKRLDDTLKALGTAAILTVSDLPQFTRRGGMIQFILQKSRVRFEVNLTAAQDARLAMNSELLRVAVAVRRNPRPTG